MKKNIFFSFALFSILAVVISSCTTMQEAGYYSEDDGYNNNRSVYIEDPLYYNSARPLLVRDAFTGRTFYVYPNNGYSPYGSSIYNMPLNNRNYSNRRAYGNGRSYRNPGRNTTAPVVSPQQKAEQRQKQESSRNLILGKE
jgi:hypothetical protein